MEEQTTYDYSKTTTTRQASGPSFHPEYVRSRAGILKIVEIILSLITFICSVVHVWAGKEWVEFVSMSAFITTGIYLVFHLINLISRFPGPWLLICECVHNDRIYLVFHLINLISRFPGPWLFIEFIYYLVFAVFFLIAAIVSAAKAGENSASIAATAFFAFAATAVYIVDTVFQFRAWHGGEAGIATRSSTATTASYPSMLEQGHMQY